MRIFKKQFLTGLVVIVNNLLKTSASQSPPENIQRNIIQKVASFFDFNDVDDDMYNQLVLPIRTKVEKRFRDFVRVNFAHTLKKNGIAEADGYSESWQQQILKHLTTN